MQDVSVAEIDTNAVKAFVDKTFDESVIPKLSEFIAIPNQSPMFDPECLSNGLQEKAAKLITDWVEEQKLPGTTIETITVEGRTPLLLITTEGTKGCTDTVLMYGHLDKQPPMTEHWNDGLGPWTPKVIDGKLYGRGGADDGYSAFAAVTAIRAIKEQGLPHGRIVTMIEASEESGSPDLFFYVDHLKEKIGTPSLIVCLDSGCGNYEQLWLTTSLRGICIGRLNVKVISEAVHSGDASGVVPDSFRIARRLLDRIEDPDTGECKVQEAYCDIPDLVQKSATEIAGTLGEKVYKDFPFLGTVQPVCSDIPTLVLNRTWRPTITVTGAEGLPPCPQAGNVIRTHTKLQLSIRLPPRADAKKAAEAFKRVLEADPPAGAVVSFDVKDSLAGWTSPDMEQWLMDAVQSGSVAYSGKPALYMGEGGSIPFMTMLSAKFPQAQFVITGVLGPQSNAHGPNEFMHIGTAKLVTSSCVNILVAHYKHHNQA